MPTTITGLTNTLTELADDDLLVADDTSAEETKKITGATLKDVLGGAVIRLALDASADGAVVGLAEVSIGMIRLTAGRTFDALAMIGTQGGASSAVLRLRRFTGGAQVASWTRAGTLASTAISAPYVVAATDWYELTLATTGAGEVALCKGLHGTAT